MASTPVSAELDAQYRVLKEDAGALIRTESAWLRVAGPDAAEYLEGQLTNDVEDLEPGAGCYSALLDHKGKMQADMRVIRIDADEFLIGTEPVAAPAVVKHLETYKVASQVEIEALEDRALISVIGPASQSVAGTPPLAEHRCAPHRLDSIAALAIGTGSGVDLLVPAECADDALAQLLAADAEPVDEAAIEILRVEAGIPRYGREMDETTIPQEAGINERAVSFTKGCYIGQETVARLHYKGKPNRYLRRLVLEAPAENGDPVATAEREVGRVGSAVVSPGRGPIALAILRREAEPGDTVTVGAGISGVVEEIN